MTKLFLPQKFSFKFWTAQTVRRLFALSQLVILFKLGALCQPIPTAEIVGFDMLNSDCSFAVYQGKIFFNAQEASYNNYLLSYDGSSVVQEAGPWTNSSGTDIEFLTVFDGDLYFTAKDDVYGYELWKFDGTNTECIDINPGSGSSAPHDLIVYNNKLYFSTCCVFDGIYSYDGTTLTQEAQVYGLNASSSNGFYEYQGQLYFSGLDLSLGEELWSFDGTSASLVADIFPGSPDSEPGYFLEYDGNLYFSARLDYNGVQMELCVYDGSSVNLAADIDTNFYNGVPMQSIPIPLAVFDGKMYLQALHAGLGFELWTFDGQTAELVEDLYPGLEHSYPDHFVEFDGALYFVATDSAYGKELRSYDGSNSINLVADLVPGTGSSLPRKPIIFNNDLHFVAYDGPTFSWYRLNASATTSCQASFSLHPDPLGTPHLWYAIDSSTASGQLTYEWDWGDGNISTGSNPTHIFDTAGYYNICLTVTDLVNNCSDTYCDNSTYIYKTMQMVTVNVVDELPTGIEAGQLEHGIAFYPNPTDERIQIDIGQGLKEVEILAYNNIGELIQTEVRKGAGIIDYLLPEASGIYLLQLRFSDDQISMFKVLKK